MIKKISISFILLFSLCVGTSIAQRSAQVTMRVSVRVVSGTSVEIAQPDIVTLKQGRKLSLGMLTMKGCKRENLLISTSSEVVLRNKAGDKLNLDLISQREKNTTGDESIRYNGIATNLNGSDVYRGKLVTTVEYL